MGLVIDKILGDALMHDHWVDAPAASNSPGATGDMAYDSDYFYIATATDTWQRVQISTWASASIVAGNPMGLLLSLTYPATP